MQKRNLHLGIFSVVAGPMLLVTTGFGGVPVQEMHWGVDTNLLAPSIGASLSVPHLDPTWLVGATQAPIAAPGEEALPPEEDELRNPFADRRVNKAQAAVRWTVNKPSSPRRVALLWGIAPRRLYELNPDIAASDLVQAGTRLVVHAADEAETALSVGSPNRGSLRNGRPMPEGPAWRMRPIRRRSYASTVAVDAMSSAFSAFAQRFPGAPKIFVGELSRRRGGSARPHVSHQSGRDADIGYVLEGRNKSYRFRTATRRSFDPEKNWYLIRALLDSGGVQQVFVGERVRRWLKAEARRELSQKDALRRYFYRIRVWPGHDDHMHVRFRCADGNKLCRGDDGGPKNHASS